jgi:hypothetical protein
MMWPSYVATWLLVNLPSCLAYPSPVRKFQASPAEDQVGQVSIDSNAKLHMNLNFSGIIRYHSNVIQNKALRHHMLNPRNSSLIMDSKKSGNLSKVVEDIEQDVALFDEEVQLELAKASRDVLEAEEFLHRGGELAYAIILGLTGLLVSTIYADRGGRVVAATVCYVLALSSIPLGLKQLMTMQNFNYPACIATWHFGCTAVLSFLVLKLQGKTVFNMSTSDFTLKIIPTSCLFSASIIFNNWGMSYSSVHFFEMISAATPLATCVVAACFGRPVNSRLLMPLVIVATAFIICFTGEIAFSQTGFLLLVLGNTCRSVRSVLYQLLLTPPVSAPEEEVSPLHLITWVCTVSFPIMAAWSLIHEKQEPYLMMDRSCVKGLGLTSLLAFALNLSGTYCIKELGAIGAQVAGELSDMTVAMGAMAMFGEIMTSAQALAYMVMCCGITWYTKRDKALQDALKQEKGEKQTPSEPLKPSSYTPLANKILGNVSGVTHITIKGTGLKDTGIPRPWRSENM